MAADIMSGQFIRREQPPAQPSKSPRARADAEPIPPPPIRQVLFDTLEKLKKDRQAILVRLQESEARLKTTLDMTKGFTFPITSDVQRAQFEALQREGSRLAADSTAAQQSLGRLDAQILDLSSRIAKAMPPRAEPLAQPSKPPEQPSQDDINKETNARFWLQTPGAKVLQPLDPKNSTDRALMPIWMNTLHRVQQEAAAGKLVLTYNKPAVMKSLADAAVAQKAAAVHATIAVKTPDPWAAQDNTAVATTATQIATQKKEEGAAQQPPTVSPKLVDEAADKAARNPPPPHAPAEDLIAHAQTQTPPQNGVLRPEDDPWDERYVPPGAPTTRPPMPPGPPMRRPMPPGMTSMRQPMPPGMTSMRQPRGPSRHDRDREHDHERGRGHGRRPPSMPAGGSVTPPGTGAPEGTPAAPSTPEGAPSPNGKTAASPPEEESSLGKYLAIGFLVLVGGATIYYVKTHKSPSPSPSSSPRATPPRALPSRMPRPPRPARAVRAFPVSSETPFSSARGARI